MNIGEKVNIRCPKCKSSNLLLHEGFMVYTTREIEKGCVVDLTGPGIPEPTRQYTAQCQREGCAHRWTLRTDPLAQPPKILEQLLMEQGQVEVHR